MHGIRMRTMRTNNDAIVRLKIPFDIRCIMLKTAKNHTATQTQFTDFHCECEHSYIVFIIASVLVLNNSRCKVMAHFTSLLSVLLIKYFSVVFINCSRSVNYCNFCCWKTKVSKMSPAVTTTVRLRSLLSPSSGSIVTTRSALMHCTSNQFPVNL